MGPSFKEKFVKFRTYESHKQYTDPTKKRKHVNTTPVAIQTHSIYMCLLNAVMKKTKEIKNQCAKVKARTRECLELEISLKILKTFGSLMISVFTWEWFTWEWDSSVQNKI